MNENAAQKRFLEFMFSEIGEAIEEIQNSGSQEQIDNGCSKLERILKQMKKEVLEDGAA